MEKIIDSIIEKINVIPSILAGVLGIIISIKTNFFSKDKVIRNKYLIFKTIRKEYSEDKINGYFALQQYFNVRLSTEEIDCILESPDAYTIFPLIKASHGKYEFKNKCFIPKITTKNYILPIIIYIISFSFLAGQLVFANNLISKIHIYNFIILSIYNLCISGPFLINSIFSINEISNALRLCKLTYKQGGRVVPDAQNA